MTEMNQQPVAMRCMCGRVLALTYITTGTPLYVSPPESPQRGGRQQDRIEELERIVIGHLETIRKLSARIAELEAALRQCLGAMDGECSCYGLDGYRDPTKVGRCDICKATEAAKAALTAKDKR